MNKENISIHAPPRGATLPFCVLFSCFLYFNSRPSARGDLPHGHVMSSGTKFQFTPLREGRHDDGTHVLRSYLFQFTPLREGRPL